MRKREKRQPGRPFPHVTLAAALDKALQRPSIRKHLRAAELRGEWESLVGANIARHVQPISLDKGILTLEADSSVWRQQINFLKPQLLDRITSDFTHLKVRDLRVK